MTSERPPPFLCERFLVSARVGLGGVPRSRRGRRGDGSKRLRPDGRSPPIVFFRKEEAFEEWESIALRQCGPRVLDIGAGAGAHALVLQGRGHEVTALDLIPEAVRIMRERGVEDAREGTLFELPSDLEWPWRPLPSPTHVSHR